MCVRGGCGVAERAPRTYEQTPRTRIGSVARKSSGNLSILPPTLSNTMSTIQEYIDKHNLAKEVEEVVNACSKARAEEPAAFMAAFLKGKTPAAITKVRTVHAPTIGHVVGAAGMQQRSVQPYSRSCRAAREDK